jgi:hypothetical protein
MIDFRGSAAPMNYLSSSPCLILCKTLLAELNCTNLASFAAFYYGNAERLSFY